MSKQAVFPLPDNPWVAWATSPLPNWIVYQNRNAWGTLGDGNLRLCDRAKRHAVIHKASETFGVQSILPKEKAIYTYQSLPDKTEEINNKVEYECVQSSSWGQSQHRYCLVSGIKPVQSINKPQITVLDFPILRKLFLPVY